jgi:hypothetical protein
MAIAAALFLLGRRRLGERASALIRAGLVPVLTVILTIGFGDPRELGKALDNLRAGYVRTIDVRRPAMDPALVQLLESSGIDHKAPMIYLDRDHMPARPRDAVGAYRATDPPYWMPANSFILFDPLPPERRLAYLRRFAERRPMGGWLASSKFKQEPRYYQWFVEEVCRTHEMVEHLENNRWWLLRLEPKGRPTRR